MSTKKIKIMITLLAVFFMIPSMTPLSIAEEEKYVLNIGTDQDPDVMNPFTTTAAASGTIIFKMYETLFFITEKGEYLPWLAERWEVSPDAKVYTFYLYNNITWSDGEPLTANDVKFTFDLLKEYDLQADTVRELVKTEVIDDYTVRFTTNSSFVPFLMRAGNDIAIVPKHIWENVPDPVAFTNNEHPIGSGPWLWDKWVQGEYVTLKKNPNYWKGEVLIDEINFITYRSDDARLLALKAGEIDINFINPNQIGTLLGVANVSIDQFEEMRLCYMGYNLRRFPFSSKLVRQAMCWAIDKQAIIDNAYNGYGTIGYDGYMSPMMSYWINPATKWRGLGMDATERYNKAKELLDEADLIDRDGDGVREAANGTKCEADMLVGAGISAFMRTAEVIRDDLAAIGIKINLIPRDIGTIIVDVYGLGDPYEPDFDCYLMTCGYIKDPDYLYMEYFSDPWVIGWNGYSGGYNNPELNKYLILQRTTADMEKRQEYVYKCQEIIAEDLPALCYRNMVRMTAYRTDKYKGWLTGEFLTGIYNIMHLQPVGPTVIEKEKIVEVEVPKEVPVEVPVETIPSWVYPTTGILAIVAVAAIVYALMRRK